jgi:hypothetical protein
MPTREEVEEARRLATLCFQEAEQLRHLWEKGLSWPDLRKAVERLFPLLAEAKLRIEPLEKLYPVGCPALPGLMRVTALNRYGNELHPTGHMQAFEVLMGLVVRIDKGGLVSQSPVTYDRDKPVVVELPEGFEGLAEWIEREAWQVANLTSRRLLLCLIKHPVISHF